MMYGDEPLLNGEAVVVIDSEGSASESDQYALKADDADNDDGEHGISGDSFEDVKLNKG